MVAKINYGSSLYGALAYNGEKVNEGVAKILETNKVFSPADGTHDISACMQDLWHICQVMSSLKNQLYTSP